MGDVQAVQAQSDAGGVITPGDPDENDHAAHPAWPLQLLGFAMVTVLALTMRDFGAAALVAGLAVAFFLAPLGR